MLIRSQAWAVLVVLFHAGAGSALADSGAATPVRMTLRPTHAALAEKQQLGPTVTGEGIERVDPRDAARRPRESKSPGNLLARSTVLAQGGFWTIVPQGAVIHVPDNFRSRVGAEPQGTLLRWKDFYARNRGWLHPQPVSFAQAAGKAPLSRETLDLHKDLARVMVAVLHGGPITLHPDRQDPEQPTPLATKP